MSATIQTQPTQQQQPSPLLNNKNNNNNNNKSSSVTDPQLKRIVYSKYRELLGSYNDKTTAFINSLPAYMVKEDRGFHFDPQIIDVGVVNNVVYGTPPAPPPLSAGSIPSQRLSTQIPQYNVAEAPACVQNAMMTKDKKPFTYTPGGIDLSQIKSQRMAKRLARNAQSEGATGQQQMQRPTQLPQQHQQSNGGPTPAASQLGATAMGMPFQVLPTGPPPPPPQPGKVVGPPPPPPPAPASAPQQNKLNPQSNGNAAPRRSPTPQKFEPPPMGFRPEIKIPPNPMASLKKVPPPQEKNNFWVEEYRKERSKSPMVGNDENDNNKSSPNNPQPETNQYSYNNNNNNNQYRAPNSPQSMRQQQDYYNQNQPSPPRTPVHLQQQQQMDQEKRNEIPYQTQYSQQPPSPMQNQTSQYASPQQSPIHIQRQISQQYSPQPQQSPTIQRQQSQQYQNSPQQSPHVERQQSISRQQQSQPQPQSQQQQHSPSIQRQQTVPQPQPQYQSPTSPQYQQQQQSSPTHPQSVPWRQQKPAAPLGAQNNVSRATESPRPQFQTQQQQYPTYLRSREAQSPALEQQSPQISQPYQQKNAQVGSIYIPPVVNQQQQQQYSQQQQAPRQAPAANRWMNSQGQPVENQTIDRSIKSPPPSQSTATSTSNSSNGFGQHHNNTGLRLQINNTSSNAKERIIPIQLEKTPTPTHTPSAPGFGPQPFYNSAKQQQYSSVPSPPINPGTPNNSQNSPNYVIRSPNQFVDQGYNQYTGVQDHPTRVTSPPVQQQHQQQQQQQPSSRIIQQTNTGSGIKTRIIPIALESQPDGPLNPNNARGPISQQPIVIQNDPRNQNQWGPGSATPTQSKSFRILQKITDTSDDNALDNKAIESDGGGSGAVHDQEPQLQRPTYARQMTSTGQINSPNVEQMKRMQLNNEQAFANRAKNQGTPPVMKQPLPNRYVNQRPVYSPGEHSQYVHPSEQQVPEPKIYTGSAIPSRSFKILQAMTTPENAGPGQSDL